MREGFGREICVLVSGQHGEIGHIDPRKTACNRSRLASQILKGPHLSRYDRKGAITCRSAARLLVSRETGRTAMGEKPVRDGARQVPRGRPASVAGLVRKVTSWATRPSSDFVAVPVGQASLTSHAPKASVLHARRSSPPAFGWASAAIAARLLRILSGAAIRTRPGRGRPREPPASSGADELSIGSIAAPWADRRARLSSKMRPGRREGQMVRSTLNQPVGRLAKGESIFGGDGRRRRRSEQTVSTLGK